MILLKIVISFLLLCSSQILASPNERNSAFLRAHLRQKAESTVARINQIQQKWTAKLNPRFAEMTDDELKGMLGVVDSIESSEEHFGSKAMDLKGFRANAVHFRAKHLASSSTTPMPSSTTPMPSSTTPMPSSTTSNGTIEPSTTTLPMVEDRFDAREEWPECEEMINKIQDQSRCGSCWAVSSASVMQDRICIGSGGKVQVDISAEDILSCPSGIDGCGGGNVGDAFRMWERDGYCTGSGYLDSSGCKPYPFPPRSHVNKYPTPPCAQNCTNPNHTIPYEEDKYFGHNRVNLYQADQVDIKQAIREGGPVIASFYVYNDFFHYYSGVYERTNGAKYAGNHAVRVIGWGVENGTTPYWLVANSWSAQWGDHGWFKIARGKDECGFERRGIYFADALI